MINAGKIQFRYEILLIFVLFEVLFFEANNSIQLIVSLLEYFFLIYVLIKNKEVGVMYFISFTVLTLGQENYVIIDSLPSNFWGIRLAGFSFNIIFSIFILIYCTISNRENQPKIYLGINSKFFIYFILYSFFIGLIAVLFSVNYSDNFIQDTLTYFPFYIYIYILSLLKTDSILKIIKYGFSLTVFMMIFSLITKKMFEYAEGDHFVLVNSFSFILPIAIFLLKGLYSRIQYFFLVSITVFLLVSGNVFIGGKTIVIFFILFLWLGINYRKHTVPLILISVIFIYFLEPIFSFFIQYFAGNVISFKFSQIFDSLANYDLHLLAATKSSMGNIIAEGLTLFHFLINNKWILLFGKGFGGSIPDIFGYLSSWAGASGYSYQDLMRNDFHKLHLPIFEVVLKTGIVGLFFYIYLLIKSLFIKNKYVFFYGLMLFTVFYVTKEMLLLTLIFLKISEKEFKETNYNSFSINKLLKKFNKKVK